MSTIELSAGIENDLQTRILRFNESIATQGVDKSQTGLLMRGPGGYAYYDGRIYLMKGTMPSDPNIGDFSPQTPNFLVGFSMADNAFVEVQPTVKPAIISTLYRNAGQDGTATWFWFTGIDFGNRISHSIIGSVGLVGSGADLEMDNNVIVNGQPYRVLNLRIDFGTTSWSY